MPSVINEFKMNLYNVGKGTDDQKSAAFELFDHELQKVLENIQDLSTDVKAREINLKFKFTPHPEHREILGIEISSSSKLSGIKPFGSLAEIQVDGDGYSAHEHIERKDPLFENVHKFHNKEENNDQ